jgi:hypothetical protein
MKLFKRVIHPTQTLFVCFLALVTIGLSGCATAAPPCVVADGQVRVVSGHKSFQFRRDWRDFKSDLADFREVTAKRDRAELAEVTNDLRQSVAAVKSYVPASAGSTCEAFVTAREVLTSTEGKLTQISSNSDWIEAHAIAAKLTDTSDSLRNEMPSWWFVRHRHGRRFH